MNYIIESVKRRINHQNKNWLAIICGETGSGKSYSALRLAEMIESFF
jgi:ABC-type dipeptide/oligopeptide/nickel transport system ATPase component